MLFNQFTVKTSRRRWW